MIEFEKYFGDVADGKIIACKKVRQQAERLIEAYINPGEFHFDNEIAQRHIDFISKFCKQPTGKLGTQLELELFQIARYQAIFGFVDDNDKRQFNEVFIVEGRKNGKTTETAAVELDLLLNDKEGAPQIYNVATQLEQAKLGFNAAYKMVKQSPLLNRHVKKRISDLYFPHNMGFIKALASNVNSLDGLDVHGAVIDELAAIKNRDIYDLVKQAMGARSQPLLFCITTNGYIRNGIFDAQYEYASRVLNNEVTNPRFLPLIYELDSPEEWDNEQAWVKANPGLGKIKKVSYLRQMVEKAKADPSFKPTVMVKDFNIPQTSSSAWLKYEELNNETLIPPEYKFKYCIGGMDAADSIDLNAAKAICMRPNDPHYYVKQMYWIPQSVIDEEERNGNRKGRDAAPYRLWKEQGLLRTTEGGRVDKMVFLEWFRELREKEDIFPMYIGYDPWHIDDSLLRAFQSEFGKKSMVPVRQGVYTLSQPMKDMKADFKDRLFIYNNNPIDKWNLINTCVKTDINGNIQPVKGLDRTQRIDGSLSLINAFTVLQDKKDEYLTLI